jgi:xanthine dehydrogenase large subunit
MLALSAYFSLRDAVVAAGGNQNLVSMDAPATPERILMAVEAARKL